MSITQSPANEELIPGIRADIPASAMRVRKRNGSYEPVMANKIIRAVQRSCAGLALANPKRWNAKWHSPRTR